MAEFLLVHQLLAHHAEDMQRQGTSQLTPCAIQELQHPEEEPQNPATRTEALYSQTLQEPGPILRAQVATGEHARHHRRVPPLQARTTR